MLADAHISSLGYLCWEGKIRIKKNNPPAQTLSLLLSLFFHRKIFLIQKLSYFLSFSVMIALFYMSKAKIANFWILARLCVA